MPGADPAVFYHTVSIRKIKYQSTAPAHGTMGQVRKQSAITDMNHKCFAEPSVLLSKFLLSETPSLYYTYSEKNTSVNL